MPFQISVMQDFIDSHQSQYVGKYRYHSGYRTEDDAFKNHYYMLDENFRQIDIYIEIRCKDQITYTFSEDLHEQEKLFIVKDALERIIKRYKYKSTLHYSLYEQYTKNISKEHMILEPIDYCDILNYMKYHKGINQETMDEYYHVFIPCLEMLIEKGKYKKFIDTVNYLLQSILYSYEWNGTDLKYLDTEYQYHLYYIREIIRMVYAHLDKFYKNAQDELFQVIEMLCRNERFSFAIMTDFGTLVLSHFQITNSLMHALEERLVLNDMNKKNVEGNLVFSYIYYIFHNNYDQYYAVIINAMRHVITNMLTFANHDLDLALGNSFVRTEGYQMILDLFHEDYNTFVFTCFPIDTFPIELRSSIEEELTTAIQYFAARMENDKYRLSSFEQVKNINRLLMDNFKGWDK